MSTQVVRVEGYSKGSLTAIGNEFDHNPNVEHRNSDIDPTRTHLNYDYKTPSKGFYAEWNDLRTALNAQFHDKKGAIAFEEMIITSDKAFFESLGYVEGQPMTTQMIKFFGDCYQWAKDGIGYRGTDANIIGARVHMDEGTPHLTIAYLPVTERWREKIYAKDASGKILRNEKGIAIVEKNDKGKTLYREVEDPTAPKLARTEFWATRGGQSSYRQMQDSFQEKVGKQYGLERGEVGSDRKHKSKAQYEHEQLEAKLEPLREGVAAINEIESAGKKLPFSSKVVIDGIHLDEIKLQASEHVAQKEFIRENMEYIREARQDLEARQKAFDEAEKAQARTALKLHEDRVELNKLLKEQRELPAQLEAVTDERDELLTKVEDWEDKAYVWEQEKAEYETEIKEIKKTLGEEIEGLKSKIKGIYEAFADAVKALALLKYAKDKDTEYRVAGLTRKQGKLIDAIAAFGAQLARRDNFPEVAEAMEKKMGISKGIKAYLDPDEAAKEKKSKGYYDDGPSL